MKTIVIPTESLVAARDLALRFRDGPVLRPYVRARLPLATAAALVFAVLVTAGVAATTVLLTRLYPPLVLQGGAGTDFAVLALELVSISAVIGAMNVAATVLNLRAPGMALTRAPFFAWAWLVTDSFMVNDLGKILDFRDAGLGTLAEGSEDKNTVVDAFEQVNFQRVWKSSEFGDRKIDVVMTPRIFLKAGIFETQIKGNEPIDRR